MYSLVMNANRGFTYVGDHNVIKKFDFTHVEIN